MVKINQIKKLSLATIAALAITAVTGLAVWAADICTTPTPDCPEVDCDK